VNYAEHDVVWTSEKIRRFWDAMSRLEGSEPNYFTRQVGDALLRFTERRVPLKGSILDYGAGRGYLTGRLLHLRRGEVYACEFSSDSASEVDTRFKGHPLFRGCACLDRLPSAYRDGCFDHVFLVEAIEHLIPEYLDSTLREIQRILRAGGSLVLTTPNEENLQQSFVACPDCGARYHRVQHVRAFSASALRSLLEGVGFKTVFCDAVDLRDDQAERAVLRWWRRFKRLFRERPRPHLVYIGRLG
jgi:SAM-dependent methyltransferase